VLLLGCVKSLPMSLGTKFFSFQMTWFWIFIGFWSFAQAIRVLVLLMHSSRGRL
jgi:hypothetical protein